MDCQPQINYESFKFRDALILSPSQVDHSRMRIERVFAGKAKRVDVGGYYQIVPRDVA